DEELQVLRDRKFADLEPYLKIAPSIKQDVENADINSSRPQNLEHPQDFFNSLGLVMSAVIGGQESPIEEAAAEKTQDATDGQTEGVATEESPDTAVPPPAAATPPVSVADIIGTLKGSSRYDKTGNEVKGAVSLPLTAVPDDVDQRKNAMVWTTEQRDEKAKTDYETWRKNVESAIQPYRPDFTFPLKADDGVEADYQELTITHPAGEFEKDVEDKFARHSREILLGNAADAARKEFEENCDEIKKRIKAANDSGHIPDPYDQLLLWAADRLMVERKDVLILGIYRNDQQIDQRSNNLQIGNTNPFSLGNKNASIGFTPRTLFGDNVAGFGLGLTGIFGQGILQFLMDGYLKLKDNDFGGKDVNAGGEAAIQFHPWMRSDNPFFQGLHFRFIGGIDWNRTHQSGTYTVTVLDKDDNGNYIWERKDGKIVTITLEELEGILEKLNISGDEREDVIKASRDEGAAAGATTHPSLSISDAYEKAKAVLGEEKAQELVRKAMPSAIDWAALTEEQYREISSAGFEEDADVKLLKELFPDSYMNYVQAVNSPNGFGLDTNTPVPDGEVFTDSSPAKVIEKIREYLDREYPNMPADIKEKIIESWATHITYVLAQLSTTSGAPLSATKMDNLRKDLKEKLQKLASALNPSLTLEDTDPALNTLVESILDNRTFEFEDSDVTVETTGNPVYTAADKDTLRTTLGTQINSATTEPLATIKKKTEQVERLIELLVLEADTVSARLDGTPGATKSMESVIALWTVVRDEIKKLAEALTPPLTLSDDEAGDFADTILISKTFVFDLNNVSENTAGSDKFTDTTRDNVKTKIANYVNTTNDEPYASMTTTQKTGIIGRWQSYIKLSFVRNGLSGLITGNTEQEFKEKLAEHISLIMPGLEDSDINIIVEDIFANHRRENVSTQKHDFALNTNNQIGNFSAVTETAATEAAAIAAAKSAMRTKIAQEQLNVDGVPTGEQTGLLDTYETHFNVTSSASTSYSHSLGTAKSDAVWVSVDDADAGLPDNTQATNLRPKIKDALKTVYPNMADTTAGNLANNWTIKFRNSNIYTPTITGLKQGYVSGTVSFHITPPPAGYTLDITLIKADGTSITDSSAVSIDNNTGLIMIDNNYLYNTYGNSSTSSIGYQVVATISGGDVGKTIQDAEVFNYAFTQYFNQSQQASQINLPAASTAIIKNPSYRQAYVEEHNITETATATATATVTCPEYELDYDETDTTTYETDGFDSLSTTYGVKDIAITGGLYQATMQGVTPGGVGLRNFNIVGMFNVAVPNISATYSVPKFGIVHTPGGVQSYKIPLLSNVEIPGAGYAKPGTKEEPRLEDWDKHVLTSYAGGDILWRGTLFALDNGLQLNAKFWVGGAWSMYKEWYEGGTLTPLGHREMGLQNEEHHMGDLYYGFQGVFGRGYGLSVILTVEDLLDKVGEGGKMPKNHWSPLISGGLLYEGNGWLVQGTAGWNSREGWQDWHGLMFEIAGKGVFPLTKILTAHGTGKATFAFPEAGNNVKSNLGAGLTFSITDWFRLGIDGGIGVESDYSKSGTNIIFNVGPTFRFLF
ncbi:hypothetical protein NO2_0885, partial [Candidatus Termititenax persephonae]